MTTTIQHNPVLLQQNEDEDIALANYLSTSLRFDQPQDLWSYPQQQYNNNVYYYQQQQQQQQQQQRRPRTRKSSNSTTTSAVSCPSINPHKSASTPISSRPRSSRPPNSHKPPPNSNNTRRKSVNSVMSLQQQQPVQDRRPSITASIASNSGASISATSIRSDMSINTKQSLSKRLRKVFSMNNLRSSMSSSDLSSLAEKNGSSASVASSVVGSPLSKSSVDERNPMSFRRRSIASLSNLFQKGASDADSIRSVKTAPKKPANVPSKSVSTNKRHSSGDLRQLVKEEKKRPDLRVDTTESSPVPQGRKGGLKARSTSSISSTNNNNNIINNSNNYNNSSVAPDSPNSAISSRSSFTRLPPPAQQQLQQPQPQRNFIHLEPGLPSPTPSTASSTKEDYVKPSIGLHYGLGLHGSPKLRPASSSTSSLVVTNERKIQFCSTIQIHETFAAADYDRRCDNNATCQKLTPMVAMKIKQELNEYKLTDMEVHVESRQYTHFFL